MSRGSRITLDVVKRVEKLKENCPTFSSSDIADITGISQRTIGRIIKGEYDYLKEQKTKQQDKDDELLGVMKQNNELLAVIATILVNQFECACGHVPSKTCETGLRARIDANRTMKNDRSTNEYQ